jgi:hypothetical protein
MPAKCLAKPDQPQSAIPYLRNKDIEVHPKERRWRQRVWSRLLSYVTERQTDALFEADPHVVLSEQIVENAAVLRNIPAPPLRILDFGGVESLLPMTLAALGYQVTVWDQRRYAFVHPLLSVVQHDIFDGLPSGIGQYDVVISISTIEHLGLGSYGDVMMNDADQKGVAALWSLVKPGGRLIATVPVGRAAIHRGYRVYDDEGLRRVFSEATSVHCFRKVGRDGVWENIDISAIRELVYEAPGEPLPVEAVAVVISDKP